MFVRDVGNFYQCIWVLVGFFPLTIWSQKSFLKFRKRSTIGGWKIEMKSIHAVWKIIRLYGEMECGNESSGYLQ